MGCTPASEKLVSYEVESGGLQSSTEEEREGRSCGREARSRKIASSPDSASKHKIRLPARL